MATDSFAVSVIAPAYREAPNIRALTERVFAALHGAGQKGELIIVDDDSQDGTQEIVRQLQASYPVRLIVRKNERGLSSAVLAGFREARYDPLVVLDADLQHPPELIPVLLDRLGPTGCDFVVGTRYGGGSLAQDWPVLRRLGSLVATCLARPLIPLSDPMSGFFALRRKVWESADALDPIGYKIALELYVKSRCRKAAEVPIPFAARAAGESKANAAEMLRYLRHLARLYRYRYPYAIWMIALACLTAMAVPAAMLIHRSW